MAVKIGERYGRLVCIGKPERKYSSLFKCDCGTEKVIVDCSVRRGATKSCGCLHKEKVTKHGMWKSREFSIWQQMIYRCYSPSSARYSDWGGRGITVCDRWKNDFSAFYADMGPKPNGKSLDRIDNDKGYFAENCRWATPKEQANNRRKVNA